MTISEHDLWGDGGNVIHTLPPSRDDLFVVVTIEGKVAMFEPVTEFQRMVQVAETLVRRVRLPRPITVKVIALGGHEAQALGLLPDKLFADLNPEQETEWRQRTIDTCIGVVRDSPDPITRADALALLQSVGALP